MKTAFLNTSDAEQEYIRQNLAHDDLVFLEGDVNEHIESLKTVEILSVFINTPVSAQALEAMPQLKLITTRSTGFDHIDLETAKARGITVTNVPTYGVRTVAEFAFALMLEISRKAGAAYERLRKTGDTDVQYFEGFNLAGKTLGVVGTGNIGKNAARIGVGFDMKVILSDVYPNEAFAKEIGAEYKDLETLVAESDFVTLHVPYMKETHHLINEIVLKKFKKGSYLINTSRGGVVDAEALIGALKNGPLAGAGLDVVEGEEDFRSDSSINKKDAEEMKNTLAAHELLDMEQVVVTPHIAFNTQEAKKEILDATLENVTSFIAGQVKNSVIAK